MAIPTVSPKDFEAENFGKNAINILDPFGNKCLSKFGAVASGQGGDPASYTDDPQAIASLPKWEDAYAGTSITLQGRKAVVLQDMNAVGYNLHSGIKAIQQAGILHWRTDRKYLKSSIVAGNDGELYTAKRDNKGVDPTVQPSADWFAGVVEYASGAELQVNSSGLSDLSVNLNITADLTANTVSVPALKDVYFVKSVGTAFKQDCKVSFPAGTFTLSASTMPTPTNPNCVEFVSLCYDKTGAFVTTTDSETDSRDLVQLCTMVVKYTSGTPTFLPGTTVANPITIRPYLALTNWSMKGNRNQYSEISIGIKTGGLGLILFDSTLHTEGANIAIHDPANASVVAIPAQDPAQFRYVDPRVLNSINGFGALVSAVDPTKYYNGTDLVAVPAGKFTVQVILFSPRGEIEVVYTSDLFDSLDAGVASANAQIVPNITETGNIFIGCLVVSQDCTDLGNTSKARYIRSFGSAGGSSGSVPTPQYFGNWTPTTILPKFGITCIDNKLYIAQNDQTSPIDPRIHS